MIRLVQSKKAINMSSFRKVSHVIFDMDGLLLDTEKFYSEITQRVLDEYGNGVQYTYDVKCLLMGLQRDEVAKKMVEIYNLPITWEEYVDITSNDLFDLMSNASLLPDTECVYEKMIEDIAKQFGKKYPFEVRMKLLGTTEQKTAQIAVTELGLPITTDKFIEMYSSMGRKRLGDVSLMRGASELVTHLHAKNIPIALATSSGAAMVEIKTQKHQDIFSLFHHKVMGSTDPDVKEGKPAPDIFLVAADRFPDKPNPADCLVFEDAPNGVRAAKLAGMQCVMVPDPNCPEELRSEATQVLTSLAEFNLEDFGLPPFDK